MYIETTQKLSKDRQDTQRMENELNQINARINNIEKKGGTKMEIDIEKDRLKRQRVRVEKNIEESKKNEKVLLKTLKENQKATKDVARLQKMFDKQKQKEMTLERNLNRTKTLIELDEQKETFKRKIEEDKRIMEDENVSPDEKQAAADRIAENTEALERLDPQIQEREEALPLRERVKNIFNKYGWTLQAVVLAAGLVLGAVALAAMNGLKAGTEALGNGLKAIGKKLGSLLPGLIGSIVSFIFRSVGQVLSFLGEHAWLLLLVVVAFFMERLLNKRRR